MYKDKKILAVIPARGGSKGIPHKNIIELCGKPLICYTIEAGLGSRYIDYVMVSTDDEEIARISKECGADIPFMRPLELASDTSKTIDVIIHTIDGLKALGKEFNSVVLLQPTQPLRDANDINRAIEKYYECGEESLVSVCEVNDHPILIRTIKDNHLDALLNISSTCRRQDMPKYYRVNGCIYINSVDRITCETSLNDNRVPFIMEKDHSVDIDEMCDLAMAEFYLKK